VKGKCEMPEIVFDGPEGLYSQMESNISLLGGFHNLNPDGHNDKLLNLYQKMKVIKDPNSCSCKKTAENIRKVDELYLSIPMDLMQNKNNLLTELFKDSTMVFLYKGKELARI
jgi:hypothetical protein